MTVAIFGAVMVLTVLALPGLFRPVAWLVKVAGWMLLVAGALSLLTGALDKQPVAGVILGGLVGVSLIAVGRRSGRWLRYRSTERAMKRDGGSWGALSEEVRR